MLTITPQASEALRVILNSDSVPDDAVIRVSADQPTDGGVPGALSIAVVESALEEDQRVQAEDVEVAVDPTAAEVLDDKQLDATVSEGQIAFSIVEQDGPGANAANNGGMSQKPETD